METTTFTAIATTTMECKIQIAGTHTLDELAACIADYGDAESIMEIVDMLNDAGLEVKDVKANLQDTSLEWEVAKHASGD